MGEEYHRMTPPVNFRLKTHGADHGLDPAPRFCPQNSWGSSSHPCTIPCEPLYGPTSPVSGLGKVFALPDSKWASTASKTGLDAMRHKMWYPGPLPTTISCS